ncbi:hypothetical protein BDC45DRAFT_569425 [Circinella umbellata]|nr:hypothetical protein BDC45DRAFT_569425 [Circinella umbellata]
MAENEDIHCNVLTCRRALCHETEACVTSCSHIFCINCANRHFNQALVCPACNTSLTQSDDIYVTQLNPSEEYKSSILSGLRPDVIMDISSRALAFYQYQTSQELSYKTIMYQSLESKYTTLQDQLRDTIRDSNRVIKAEKQKNTNLTKDQEQEKRRVHDLQNQLHEKTRQFQKLQIMFEKVKRKTVTPNIQQSLNQQQLTPESMSSTGITPTFSATENASKLRRPYSYAAPTMRAESPVSTDQNYYTGTDTMMEDSNQLNPTTLTNPLQHASREATPASPLPVHHHHHNRRTGEFLLTSSYVDQNQQPPFLPPLQDRQSHSSKIPQQQQQQQKPMNHLASSKHHYHYSSVQQPQQQTNPNFYYKENRPPATAVVRGSRNHHQILDNNTNNNQYYSNNREGYATVVSPRRGARSVVTSIGRREPMSTPSPRSRPFTSSNRVSLPQQQYRYHQ